MHIGQAVWQTTETPVGRQIKFGMVREIGTDSATVQTTEGTTETWTREHCHKVRDGRMAQFVEGNIPHADSQEPPEAE